MTVAKLLVGALAATSLVSATLPKLGGVNLAGLDFGIDINGGSGNFVAPPLAQVDHFAAAGANAVRIPFGWQYATPQLGGALNANFFATLDALVQRALSKGQWAILDLHNYARFNGGIVGQGGPTNAQFASIWSQLAAKYKSNSKVIFGLMNEPHDLNVQQWATSVQAAVNAIRAAGAATQHILLPGSEFTHANEMIANSGPALLKVTDPAGGTDKLVFDIHEYLDSDDSGTQGSCTTDNVQKFTNLNNWLKGNGRHALVTETGVPNNANCIAKFKAELAYIKGASNIDGFTAWAAGSFDSSYLLSLTPSSTGADNAVFVQAVKPNFP